MDVQLEPVKEIPQSLEAEVSVLGAMLLEPAVIDAVGPLLNPNSFSRPSHRAIFQSIIYLHQNQRGIDLVPVMEELKRVGKLDEAGGVEYLAYLVDAVPSATNAIHYAEIVREKAMKRELMDVCRFALSKVAAGKDAARDLLDSTLTQLFHIAEEGMTKDVAELRDVLKSAFERIDRWREKGDRYTGLQTGYLDLDDLTSGLQNGELIIVAGRPSMGKTTFSLNVAANVAITSKKPVAVFSLEMSEEQIAMNLLCREARLDSHKLRRGQVPSSDYSSLSEAVGRLSEAKIYIDDTAGVSCFEVRAKARMLKARHGLGLIVIDYLQLMEGPNIDSREQQISQISRGLKALARELEVPVIAISQLNRAPEAREDGKPRMADLRESGAIEQDADVVMLIHQPSRYRNVGEDGEAGAENIVELQVVKQRNGPTGDLKLSFIKSQLRFESYAEIPGQERGNTPL
jgi:replicative DNA helicase